MSKNNLEHKLISGLKKDAETKKKGIETIFYIHIQNLAKNTLTEGEKLFLELELKKTINCYLNKINTLISIHKENKLTSKNIEMMLNYLLIDWFFGKEILHFLINLENDKRIIVLEQLENFKYNLN